MLQNIMLHRYEMLIFLSLKLYKPVFNNKNSDELDK